MQLDYGLSRPPLIGSLADTMFKDILSFANKDPMAKQVDTATITNYVAAKIYTYVIDGITKTYTATAADADNTGVAHSIAAQINADPLVSGKILATNLLGVITLTARIAGRGWTLVGGVDFTVVHTTANAVAAAIPFGRLVVSNGQDAIEQSLYARIARATNLTARAVVLTPTFHAEATYYVHVTVDGTTYTASYTPTIYEAAADLVAALANNLMDLLPATIDASDVGVTLVLTSLLAGQDFTFGFGESETDADWVVTSDNGGELTDVNVAARGVAVKDDAVEINDEDEPGYVANSVMATLRYGRIIVRTEAQITVGEPVYVRLADSLVTGEPLGAFRGSAAVDCVKLDSRRFRWVRRVSAVLAELQVACD